MIVSSLPNSLSAEILSPSPSPRSPRRMSLQISKEDLSGTRPTFSRRDSGNPLLSLDRFPFSQRQLHLKYLHLLGGDALPWKERVCRSIDLIESERDLWMEDATLIGRVSRKAKEAKWHIRLKSVQFSWQRGVKIGKLVMNFPPISNISDPFSYLCQWCVCVLNVSGR